MALTDKLTAIADTIRGKTGGTEEMTLDAMVSAIEGIEVGGGLEYIEGEVTAGTGFNSLIHHNAGWSKYIYIAYAKDLPSESDSAYSSSTLYMVLSTVGGIRQHTVGLRKNLSSGEGDNRAASPNTYTDGDLTNKIALAAGLGYKLRTPAKWIVINMEGKYL